MSKERTYQSELSKRASDELPFDDEMAIKEVSKLILDERSKGKNEIIYPFNLSPHEVFLIMEYFNEHHRKLAGKILILPGAVRMPEGLGTLITMEPNKK